MSFLKGLWNKLTGAVAKVVTDITCSHAELSHKGQVWYKIEEGKFQLRNLKQCNGCGNELIQL